MITDFQLGDRILMKKPHACGSSEWQVVRVGADIKIKCYGCGRLIMMERAEFIKRAKKNLSEKERSEHGE